jgi:hypothetical protein
MSPFEKFKSEISVTHAYMLLEWNDKQSIKFALYELTEQNLYALLALAGIRQDN